MRRATAVFLLVGVSAVGCGDSPRPETRLFALADRYDARADFEASVLLRIDPTTLQPVGRRGLRLGDYVTTRALSPNGRTLALGGNNFGEVLFVDLSRPTRVTHMTVASGTRYGEVQVDVHGWPRRSGLVVVATVDGAWSGPHPSRLLIVDPQRRRVIRRKALHGTLLSSVSVRDGTIALLVIDGRVPTLVVVRPNGSTWSKRLSRLDLGGHDGVRLAGVYYRPRRDPGLVTDGGERVFVVASDRPIAEIRLRTHEVRYHGVPMPRSYLSYPPPSEPGSGGVNLRFATSAVWLGNEQLAIGGFDELPGRISGFGVGHRFPERKLQIIDARSWRRVRTISASLCERTGDVVLCRATKQGFPPDAKGRRGPSLIAYDERWRRLYEKQSPQLWWDVTAGRLVAGSADGHRISELDPATGRTVQKIKPAPLENDMWPLDLFAWTPRR